MLQAFIMVLREGFESFLIVAVILSYLKKTEQKWLYSAVYAAIAVSLVASAGLGYVLMLGVNQSLWEGVLGLVTVVLVGTLVVHMWKTGPRFRQHIQDRLASVSKKTSGWAVYLGVFAFTVLMITREGMETALMLLQVRDRGVIGGIFLGLASAGGMAWLWARFGSLIDLKRFFQVTGLFLILFMIQVAVYSFHEFSESGLIPNSEAIHAATEPFSPVGIYGQWFSLVAIGVCGLWLVAAKIMDRCRRSEARVFHAK